MDGYIISLKHDNESQVKYWAGSATTENINDAMFIPDVTAARRTVAGLQNQFLDHSVTLHPAFKGIQLKDVASATFS